MDWKALEIVHPDAAGIDVGGSEHWVAISPDRDPEPVRRFGCFTADVREMGRWLVEKGVRSVAMQSTGVYWMPVFEVLEQQGLEVYLVNAQHTKNVPGRNPPPVDRMREPILESEPRLAAETVENSNSRALQASGSRIAEIVFPTPSHTDVPVPKLAGPGAALDERGTVRECVADVAVDERHKIAEFILPGRHFHQVLQVLLLPV